MSEKASIRKGSYTCIHTHIYMIYVCMIYVCMYTHIWWNGEQLYSIILNGIGLPQNCWHKKERYKTFKCICTHKGDKWKEKGEIDDFLGWLS